MHTGSCLCEGVQFERLPEGTEIIITNEKISSTAVRDQHEHGWYGCLDGLDRHTAQRS